MMKHKFLGFLVACAAATWIGCTGTQSTETASSSDAGDSVAVAPAESDIPADESDTSTMEVVTLSVPAMV